MYITNLILIDGIEQEETKEETQPWPGKWEGMGILSSQKRK
jgi:hypothetical protein